MSVPEIAFSPSDLIRWRSHLKTGDPVIWYPNGIVTLINRNAQSGTWDVTGDQILGVRSAPEHDLRPMPGTNNRAKPPIDAPPVEDVQFMPDVDADVTPMTPFRTMPAPREVAGPDSAFTSEWIFKAHKGALASKAIAETSLHTQHGRLFVKSANHLRWNEDTGEGEVYFDGTNPVWVPVTEIGIEELSRREHLHWRKPDGTVLRWDAEAEPFNEEPEHIEEVEAAPLVVVDASAGEEVTGALTTGEIALLTDCEKVIERGLKTFVEVGTALADIRDGRLYRETHKTFEAYCAERWDFGRNRANRLIQAADVAANLVPIGTIPANEAQARELTRLNPDAQREAWTQAVETAPEGRITAAHVRTVVDAMHAPETQPAPTSAAQRDDIDPFTGEIVDAVTMAYVDPDIERLERAGDFLTTAIRNAQYAINEALGMDTALDANLRLTLKHAEAALAATESAAQAKRDFNF